MVLTALLALLASGAALEVEVVAHEVSGPAGSEASFEVSLVREGPLEVRGAGKAALGGGPEATLPVTFPEPGPPCEGPCPVDTLRLTLLLPEEPATSWFVLLDDEGGLLLPVRLVPEAPPAPSPSPPEPNIPAEPSKPSAPTRLLPFPGLPLAVAGLAAAACRRKA